MRIRLLANLPIERKHGATKGREFEVKRRCNKYPGGERLFFEGDEGEECAAFWREVEVVEA